MTRFQVDSEVVIASTTATRGTIGRFQAEASALQAQLNNLQATWSGSAATAFQSAVSEWSAAYQRVEQALSGLNEALGHVAHGYADVEQQAARMFMR
jgi:WXG100 family type VII secretion target